MEARLLGWTALAGALALGLAAPAGAVTIDIAASRDNTLYETEDGSLSNGAGEYLFAGPTGTGELRRGLIMFDIAAFIPAGAVITGVELTLHMSRTRDGANRDLALHRVLSDWGEGASDAPLNEGGGSASQTGDATWLHTFYNTTLWTTAGGDFAPAASAVTGVGTGINFYTWSQPGMVLDVQDWLDSPAANFGWILLGNESVALTARRFDSRENSTEAFRPVLRVQFDVPEPSALGLLGLGLLGAALRRRGS